MPPGHEAHGIWRDHVPAFSAFCAVATQWRIVSREKGRPWYAGLDFAGAEAGLRLAGIEPTPALWAQVRIIETAARAALNGD